MDLLHRLLNQNTLTTNQTVLIWIISSFLTVLIEGGSSVTVDVYWNKSNVIFQGSNDDHIMELALKDKLRFHCPHYDDSWSNTPKEYYIIYRVPEVYYDTCTLPDLTDEAAMSRLGIRRVITCNNPDSMIFFSTVLDRFSPLPGSHGGLTFQPGQSYYFISISSGTLEGLNNRDSSSSSCYNHNMKLKLNVCCTPGGEESLIRHYPTPPPSMQQSTTTRRSYMNNNGDYPTTQTGSHVRRHNNNTPRLSDIQVTTTDPFQEKTTEIQRQLFPQAIINAEVRLDNSCSSLKSSTVMLLTLSLATALCILTQR